MAERLPRLEAALGAVDHAISHRIREGALGFASHSKHSVPVSAGEVLLLLTHVTGKGRLQRGRAGDTMCF